jgi:hypothetical protein
MRGRRIRRGRDDCFDVYHRYHVNYEHDCLDWEHYDSGQIDD